MMAWMVRTDHKKHGAEWGFDIINPTSNQLPPRVPYYKCKNEVLNPIAVIQSE